MWRVHTRKLHQNPKNKTSKFLFFKNVSEESHRGILNKKEARYLVPKVHKNQKKPPKRSIIKWVVSLFFKLGEYIDTFYNPWSPMVGHICGIVNN